MHSAADDLVRVSDLLFEPGVLEGELVDAGVESLVGVVLDVEDVFVDDLLESSDLLILLLDDRGKILLVWGELVDGLSHSDVLL